jgi:hypothetical protein
MSHLTVLPPVAYLLAIIAVLASAASAGTPRRGLWCAPAGFAVLFWVQSLCAVWNDGLATFWVNHTANMVGNQVWFDLLFVVSIAFFAMAPRARAQGMPLWPWAVATVCVAGLALLPMLARLLYLEERQARLTKDQPTSL